MNTILHVGAAIDKQGVRCSTYKVTIESAAVHDVTQYNLCQATIHVLPYLF